MNKWDYLILAIILIMVIIAFHFARDRKKNGCCGGNGCGSCDLCASRENCQKNEKKSDDNQ